MLRRLPIIAMMLVAWIHIFAPTAPATRNQPSTDTFANLRAKLIKDGFKAKRINRLYGHPKVFFDLDTAALMFGYNEARADYGQFAKPKEIAKAKKYLKTHAKALAKAETEYRVDRHIITAIILVESRLGAYTGRSAVFNTLSTLSVLSKPKLRDKVWKAIPKKKRSSRKKFVGRIKKRSRWGL